MTGTGYSAWNCKNGSRRRLRRYLRSRKRAGDVAVALIEVWRVIDDIDDIAAEMGWRMLAERPIPGGREREPITEQGDTVLLLSPRFRLREWEVVPLSRRWYVPDFGKWHQPRRLIRAVGEVDGQTVELLAVHGPTANGFNALAIADFKTTVADIATRTRPDVLTVIVGDFNIRLDAARAWAKSIGADVAGHGPDLALVRGGQVTSKRSRSKRGSDHYALAHRVRPNRRSSK